jgi:hypothetical protein
MSCIQGGHGKDALHYVEILQQGWLTPPRMRKEVPTIAVGVTIWGSLSTRRFDLPISIHWRPPNIGPVNGSMAGSHNNIPNIIPLTGSPIPLS